MPAMHYFDDLSPGMQFRTGEIEVSLEEIVAFATRFDPQPFHIDPRAAKDSVFRGLAASGWMTASLTMRLIVTDGANLAGGWVGLGLDLIYAVSEVVSKRSSKSNPGYGIVKIH